MWGGQLYSHGEGKQMDRYFPRPTVISAKAGQPPIGKPPNRLDAKWRPLPAVWYLPAFPHLLFLPRFFALWRPCRGSPSQPKLALSLPIKGPSFCLPDRNGAVRSPEDRSVFFQKRTDAPILRCLRHHPLPVEGGSVSSSCSTSNTKPNPVTPTLYSSPPKAAIPQPSGQRPVKPKPPPAEGRSILRTFLKLTPLSSVACGPLPEEGGYKLRQSRHLPPERKRTQPFYTTRCRQATPTCASGAPLFNLPRSGQHNLRAQRARPLSGCAAFPLSPTKKAHRITDGLFLTV